MSVAAFKRKTLNGNPRLAPVSGSNNGKFGFSLNGTRRNVGRVGITNLAPGAMSGPSQMIGSTPANPTGPGIHGHPSHVCTNDPLVVKTSVINTRGMLSRRANGFSRAVPMAPKRSGNNGCGLGIYLEDEYYQECVKTCPPNWVKNPIIPNGDQGQYISRFVRVRGNTHGPACDSTKSYNGIIGYVNGAPIPNPSCNLGWGSSNGPGTGWKPLEGLLFAQRGNFIGPRRKTNNCPVTKPGITTINYDDYNARRVLINNCLPATGVNAPIPNVIYNSNGQCKNPNILNVNIPLDLQGNNVYNYIVESGQLPYIANQLKTVWCKIAADKWLGTWSGFVNQAITGSMKYLTSTDITNLTTKVVEISGIPASTLISNRQSYCN